MAKITVANVAQQALMELELQGQISDGWWENAKPWNHWQGPSGADVVVGSPTGMNFRPKRTYDFTAKELLDVVGVRMLAYARIAKKLGMDKAREAQWKIGDDGVPESGLTPDIVAAAADPSYSMADMKNDLRALSGYFKTAWAGMNMHESKQLFESILQGETAGARDQFIQTMKSKVHLALEAHKRVVASKLFERTDQFQAASRFTGQDFSYGEDFDAKDAMRISDLLVKSRSDSHAMQLANQMANAITDPEKALRRANAAHDANTKAIFGSPKKALARQIANVFYTRYLELGR